MTLNLMNVNSIDGMSYLQNTRESRVSPAARALFSRYNRTSLISRLLFKKAPLQDLQTALSGKKVLGRHSLGLRTVALDQVAGSEGRSDSFDTQFHPVKSNTEYRWLRVATARDEGLGLPPVELIQFGNEYFVRDGNHRISVAMARGEKAIEAMVTAWEAE